ncbi:hypothetical protein SBADM41S_06401 [Streptomyces badius]
MKCCRTVDVVRGDLPHGLRAVLGEDREEAAPVRLAVRTPYEPGGLHAGDLVRKPALGLEGGGGEVAIRIRWSSDSERLTRIS